MYKGSFGRYFVVGGILCYLFVVFDMLIFVFFFKIVGIVG